MVHAFGFHTLILSILTMKYCSIASHFLDTASNFTIFFLLFLLLGVKRRKDQYLHKINTYAGMVIGGFATPMVHGLL
jgi:succinate-acetate transporter protein